jgi:hypothetical protein
MTSSPRNMGGGSEAGDRRQERRDWSGGVLEETAEKVSRPLRHSCANFLSRGCGGGIRVEDEHREVFSYSGSWLLTPELAPDS